MSSTGGLYILTSQSDGNHLIHFDTTSKKQWDKKVPSTGFDLMVFKNELISTGNNNTIYAYSKDGILNWKYTIGSDKYMQIFFNDKTSMVYAQTLEWVNESNGNYYPKRTITALKENTVEPVTAVSINLVLKVGSTASFEAMVSPTNATNQLVTWSSSDTKVATVDSKGNVTALKAGKATITSTTKDGAKKASIGVTVK